MDKFNLIELYEVPFYLLCKTCKNPPEILLNDREKMTISCNKCGIYEEEKIINIVNYSSKWVTNSFVNIQPCSQDHSPEDKDSIYVDKKEKIKSPIPSSKFCKTCNLFLCDDCFKKHNDIFENHNYAELYQLRANCCNIHNEKFTHYCHIDEQYICYQCNPEHKTHYIEKYEVVEKEKIAFIKTFEKFISNSEKIKNDKFKKLNEHMIWLKDFSKDDNESKEELNNTLNKLFEIFSNDLKIEINLVLFAKILFSTCIIFEKKDIHKELLDKYKDLINIIEKYFENEKVEEFNKMLIEKKKKFIAFANRLTKEEICQLKTQIKDMFKEESDKISDFDKTKNFIQNNLEYSSKIKRYIAKEKAYNPENYIKIDETIGDLDNLGKEFNSDNSEYVLSLIGKSIENQGIEMNISKKKDEQIQKVELASIQSIFTLTSQKKYDLHFDFGAEENKNIINDPIKKEEFIKKYKEKIAKKLNIEEKNIILTDIQKGSVTAKLSIVNEGENKSKYMEQLKELEHIKEVEEKPLLESLQISPAILDKRGDRYTDWGINEKRGGEDYIPPLNGWYGIGLKVWGEYDNGNNDWLDYDNNKNEYAIAYLGLNSQINNDISFINNVNELSTNVSKYTVETSYQEQINRRSTSFFGKWFGLGNKCGEGIRLYQKPDDAERYASIVEIPGLGINIKMMLMCRVKPSKIREPEKMPNCWILNPTPEEIRPYRILLKKVPKSALAISSNEKLIVSLQPEEKLIDIMKSKNYIFYDLANDKNYSEYAYINGQKLSNDNFIFRIYTSNYFGYLNNYLRFGKVEWFSEEQIKSWACCLQLALNRNKGVKDDTIVYRGIRRYKFPEDFKPGTNFYFKEFISTTTNKKVAKDFKGDEGGTIIKIIIKNNGTNNKNNYCYSVKSVSKYKNEDEILISSNCLYTITNIERSVDCDFVEATCEGFFFDLYN